MTELPVDASCWHRLFAEAPEQVRRELGLAALVSGGKVLIRSRNVPHLMLNRALGLDGASGDVGTVDECLSFFQEAHCHRFFIHVPERASSDPLRRALSDRKLVPYHRNWVKFVRDVEPVWVPAVRFEIREMNSADASRAAEILCTGFDFPMATKCLFESLVGREGFHTFVAGIPGGEPAGVGSVFIEGRSACLAFAATDPAFRGRGIQQTLMAKRIERARQLGCQEIVTETGARVEGERSPSMNNMLRCGFSEAGEVENWTLPGTTWVE